MKKSLGVLLTTVALLFASSVVRAQTTLPLTVAPARQQISLNPGEESQIMVKFYNQSDFPLAGLVKVADFVVDNDQGTPRIIEDASQASPKFSASAWMSLLNDRTTIPANDKTTVQVTIDVPKEALPGGRYVAVFFEPVFTPATAVGQSATGIVPRIASLLYIRVNGPIKEDAIISNMFAKSFYEYGPIDVSAQIANNGDYHIRPQGTFVLTDSLGGIVQQSSLKAENIFPDALRVFTTSIGEKWMMGRYKISLSALYGEKNNKTMERSIYVWVFPWRVTLIVILTLIILGIISRAVYKNIIVKETSLEEELSEEKKEIEKLKKELGKRE